MTLNSWRNRLFALTLAIAAGAVLTACDDDLQSLSGRAAAPIPTQTLALMDKIGTTPSAPVLIRAYKQEAEFEIWKMKVGRPVCAAEDLSDVPLVGPARSQDRAKGTVRCLRASTPSRPGR